MTDHLVLPSSKLYECISNKILDANFTLHCTLMVHLESITIRRSLQEQPTTILYVPLCLISDRPNNITNCLIIGLQFAEEMGAKYLEA